MANRLPEDIAVLNKVPCILGVLEQRPQDDPEMRVEGIFVGTGGSNFSFTFGQCEAPQD